MIPNSSVYGTPQEWHLADFGATDIYFPAWGTNALDYGKLSEGVAEGKIFLSNTLDQSISYVGLGSESAYSNIISTDSQGHFKTDSRTITNFFLSYGDLTYRYYIPKDSSLTWNVNNLLPDNLNAMLRPIVSFNPSKILWWILVTASSVPEPEYDYQVIGVRLYQYVENVNNWQIDFPYIKAAYMVPAFDTSETDTPDRQTTGNSINLSINEPRSVNGLENFITYTDLSLIPIPAILTAHTTRQGILLRGSREGLGDTHQTSDTCAYFLGDISCISHDNGIYTYAEEYSAEVIEAIIKEAACFCMPFIADVPIPEGYTVNNVPLTDNCVYWGYPDNLGISHGDYTQGAGNVNNPVYGWDNTTDSPYDYNNIPSDYDHSNHFNTVSIAQFNNYYVMSYNQVRDLAKEVYKALQRKPSDVQTTDYSLNSFLTNSPIDGIISIKRYPVYDIPKSNTANYITIGNYTSDTISAYTLFNDPTRAFLNFSFSGTKRFDEKFGGSFLDREPYTTAELYIPFCGTVPISVADYIGHNINIKLAIDYKSGSCTAYVLRDSTPLQAANGQIGIDIPVTGISTSQVDSQLLNANLRLKESQRQVQSSSYGFLSAGAGIGTTLFGMGKGTGSMAGAMSMSGAANSLSSFMNTGVNFENAWDNRTVAAYELHHIQTPFKSISAGSPLTAAMGELCCRLTIYRPILSPDYDSSVYAKTVGFACLINGKVRDFTGLTEGAIDLSGINCTDKEKSLIATAFKQGVFLKPTPLGV